MIALIPFQCTIYTPVPKPGMSFPYTITYFGHNRISYLFFLVPKAQVKSRVILAPEHAKRLLGALQENIVRYEREYGPIKIPSQEPRTIAPFPVGKGEA